MQADDSIAELMVYLGLNSDEWPINLRYLAESDSPHISDLLTNLRAVMKASHLSDKQLALLSLCITVNDNNALLTKVFTRKAKQAMASPEEVAEAIGCASYMAMQNTIYRFRHLANTPAYDQLPTRFKVGVKLRPVTGKVFFTLMCLAVSVANNCELCVRLHEKNLTGMDVPENHVFDAVKLTAVVSGLGKVI